MIAAEGSRASPGRLRTECRPTLLPPCPNCGSAATFVPSEDDEWPVLLRHKVSTCPYGTDIYHETEALAAGKWMEHLRHHFPRRFPGPKAPVARKAKAASFADLAALGPDERREWMRGWMARMGLENANQAAPVLALTRQSVERMLYETNGRRTAVTDQTLRVAQLAEMVGMKRAG